MIGAGRHNFRELVRYQLFNSAAISLASNWVVTDMLLLEMRFDLGRFGAIRSSMFLLPSILYFLAAGVLERLNRDRVVCLVSYAVRVALPLTLPVAALLTKDRTVLFGCCLIVFSLSYTCAMFANNSLLTIFRQALPAGEFNRSSMLLNTLPGAPAALPALLGAGLLAFFRGDRMSFFLCFLVMEGAVALFEIPAIRAMLRVRVTETPRREPRRWRDLAGPFRNRSFVALLGFTAIHRIWVGLLATYFVVWLLTARAVNPGWIILIEMMLSVFITLLSPGAGRLADRFGYAATMIGGTLLLLTAALLFGLFPHSPGATVFFIALLFTGNGGLVAGTMIHLESSAASRLADGARPNSSVAIFALTQSLGTFAGCLFAGVLWRWTPGTGEAHFLTYFNWCMAALPLMLLAAIGWQSNHRQQQEVADGTD